MRGTEATLPAAADRAWTVQVTREIFCVRADGTHAVIRRGCYRMTELGAIRYAIAAEGQPAFHLSALEVSNCLWTGRLQLDRSWP